MPFFVFSQEKKNTRTRMVCVGSTALKRKSRISSLICLMCDNTTGSICGSRGSAWVLCSWGIEEEEELTVAMDRRREGRMLMPPGEVFHFHGDIDDDNEDDDGAFDQ